MNKKPSRMPGFTTEVATFKTNKSHPKRASGILSELPSIVPQAMSLGGGLSGFGGFGPTLPQCHYEYRCEDCGSALPGYPIPQCCGWVQICVFPGSSRSIF